MVQGAMHEYAIWARKEMMYFNQGISNDELRTPNFEQVVIRRSIFCGSSTAVRNPTSPGYMLQSTRFRAQVIKDLTASAGPVSVWCKAQGSWLKV
jgi:hypothetical protein